VLEGDLERGGDAVEIRVEELVAEIPGRVDRRPRLALALIGAEQDAGARSGPTSGDADRLAALERENRELKRANDLVRKGSAFCAAAGCLLRDAPFGNSAA
jgi:transposase